MYPRVATGKMLPQPLRCDTARNIADKHATSVPLQRPQHASKACLGSPLAGTLLRMDRNRALHQTFRLPLKGQNGERKLLIPGLFHNRQESDPCPD